MYSIFCKIKTTKAVTVKMLMMYIFDMCESREKAWL